MRSTPGHRIGRLPLAAGLAAAAALLASCWLPLFDPEVSASAELARRLGSPVLSFMIENIQKNYAQKALFVPVRTDISTQNPVYGMLISIEETSVTQLPLQYYTDTSTYFFDIMYSRTTENIFQYFPLVVSAHDFSGVSVFSTTDVTTAYTFSTFTYAEAGPPAVGLISGVGSVQAFGAATDTISFCFLNSGTLNYYSLTSYVVGYISYSLPGVPLGFPSTAILKSSGTFFDTGTYLYLSCGLSDGTDAIFRWETASPGETPVRYSAAYGPLVAGLSDGRLLASDGVVTTVLSPGMKKLFSFPSGTLRFVHERYDGTETICVFTRTSFVRDSNGDDRGTARIEVYEIPTARLSELGS